LIENSNFWTGEIHDNFLFVALRYLLFGKAVTVNHQQITKKYKAGHLSFNFSESTVRLLKFNQELKYPLHNGGTLKQLQ